MGISYIDTINDFEYDGEKIPIMLHFEKESGFNTLYRIEFEYKKCRVIDWYYREDSLDMYSLTRMHCMIIDKYGSSGTKRFIDCKEKISEIEAKFIVLDNKVYKIDKSKMDIPPHKYYIMQVKMCDETILDGSSFLKGDVYTDNRDEYSYSKTFENLKLRVSNYYRHNKILPCDEYYLEEKTIILNNLKSEYKDMLSADLH